MAESLENFSKFIAENKGQRKFKQTVELAINFKGIDFAKQDNRINIDIVLPNGKGKVKKIAVFSADRNLSDEARKHGVEVIDGTEIEKIAQDPTRLASLLNYELIAQPALMAPIAKSLGQFLGPRNKMPKPLVGNVNMANITDELNKRITIKNRGKNLPTLHCVVGSEDMEPAKLFANIQEVIAAITRKVGQNHIKSSYVKLTMSKPLKL